jgi:hypothetical protein
MVFYKCEKCDYKTERKSNYTSHINRKTPCNTVTAGITAVTAKTTVSATAATAVTVNATAATAAITTNEKQCKYCSKIFKRKYNLSEHIKLNRCKKQQLQTSKVSEDSDDEFIIEYDSDSKNEVQERLKKLEENYEELKKKPSNINNYHINCVMLDEESIRNALQSYNAGIFYGGPEMVINLLKDILYKNDIRVKDVSRQMFQYMTLEDGEEKIVKDLKHTKALKKIGPEYKKQTAKVVDSELEKFDKDSYRCLLISEKAQEHYDTIENKNKWSTLWLESVV